MTTVTLTRFAYSPMGSFGRLEVDDFECFTVERPWEGNQPNISCIPIGEYPLRLGMYYGGDGQGGRRDYPAYEILDVPGRSLIKIHIANTMDDLKGCIGPGQTLGYLEGLWAVTSSTTTLGRFMEAMNGEQEARLVIRNIDAGTP